MGRVIVGVDPHKKSVTIEVVDADGQVLATGRFDTTSTGYRLMTGYVAQWPDRRWAVEGANGMGRPLAQRLLAQGETVLDVPATSAARVRVFDTGNARKTTSSRPASSGSAPAAYAGPARCLGHRATGPCDVDTILRGEQGAF